jgi:hypothetical protein
LRQTEKTFIGQYHLEGFSGIKPLSDLARINQSGDKNQQGDQHKQPDRFICITEFRLRQRLFHVVTSINFPATS